MLLCSPFEQFEVVQIVGLVSNSVVMFLFVLCVLIVMKLVCISSGVIRSSWSVMLGRVVEMGEEVCRSVGINLCMRSSIMVYFIVILILNMLGGIPYSSAVTSQVVVTSVMSISVWIGKLCIGVRRHGWRVWSSFYVGGVPFIMVPAFVMIEVVGFLIPMLSLSIRLFANIMSGHVLMVVLFSFIWKIMMLGGMTVITVIVPECVMLCLIGMELGVGLIQSYVFILLTSLYVKDMEQGSH